MMINEVLAIIEGEIKHLNNLSRILLDLQKKLGKAPNWFWRYRYHRKILAALAEGEYVKDSQARAKKFIAEPQGYGFNQIDNEEELNKIKKIQENIVQRLEQFEKLYRTYISCDKNKRKQVEALMQKLPNDLKAKIQELTNELFYVRNQINTPTPV